MLPKDFVGTWEMTEEYRELIVIDTVAYRGEYRSGVSIVSIQATNY